MKCRDPTRIPKKRMVGMKDELFVISFTTEGFVQLEKGEDKGDGDDGDDDPPEDDPLDGDKEGEKGNEPQDDKPNDQ